MVLLAARPKRQPQLPQTDLQRMILQLETPMILRLEDDMTVPLLNPTWLHQQIDSGRETQIGLFG